MQAEGTTVPMAAAQQQLLAAQAYVSGVGAHFLGQAGGDVRPQFGGGCVGKGHDEQAVGFHGVDRVGDEAHHPLDQHAGPCRNRAAADTSKLPPRAVRRPIGRG